MENEACDFWGFNGYKHGKHRNFKSYISSNFYVFRKKVLFSRYIDEFFSRIVKKYDRNGVIAKLESEFTAFLEEKGFLWQTVCDDFELDSIHNPLSLLKKYRVPLVKKKAFQRTQHEDMNEVFKIISENNPKLRECIHFKPVVLADYKFSSIKEHLSSLEVKRQKLSQKAGKREKISAILLTGVWDHFPSQSLFEEMCKDSAFNPYIAVIPDLRKGSDSKMEILLEVAKREKELQKGGIAEERIIPIRLDHIDLWTDICSNFDIVFYNSPQSFSSFRYAPRYSVGRNFLPIMINDDISDLNYDERILCFDAYRYCWKVFFSNEKTLEKYQKLSADKGKNAVYFGNMQNDSQSSVRVLDNLKQELGILNH